MLMAYQALSMVVVAFARTKVDGPIPHLVRRGGVEKPSVLQKLLSVHMLAQAHGFGTGFAQ
jgi:hypothetical protein